VDIFPVTQKKKKKKKDDDNSEACCDEGDDASIAFGSEVSEGWVGWLA